MKDNFDLKKFLIESKAMENLNPSIKAVNENIAYEDDAEADDAEHIDALEKDMKDDKRASLKAKIKEMIVAELDGAAVEAEDYDPVYEGEDPEEDNYDYSNDFYDGDPNDFGDTDEFDGYGGYDIDEAKKKDEDVENVEDVEDVEVTDTTEEVPAEEAPAAEMTGGIEDLAANMEGTEADLMDHLMKAFQIAKGMNNEKLETQVGNTLKFFVSEYIGGGE